MISLIPGIILGETIDPPESFPELTPDASGNIVLNKDQVITIANYINDLEDENAYLRAKVETLEKAIENERKAARVIEEADKLKERLKEPWFDNVLPWLTLVGVGVFFIYTQTITQATLTLSPVVPTVYWQISPLIIVLYFT
jgi:hypothetical protein